MISDYFLLFLTIKLLLSLVRLCCQRASLVFTAILCSPSCRFAVYYAIPPFLKCTEEDHMLAPKSSVPWDVGRTPGQPVLSSIYVWLSSLWALERDPYVALAASHLHLLRRCSTASFCYSRCFASLGQWWGDIDRHWLQNSQRALANALNAFKPHFSFKPLIVVCCCCVFLYANLLRPKRFSNSVIDMSESLCAQTY